MPSTLLEPASWSREPRGKSKGRGLRVFIAVAFNVWHPFHVCTWIRRFVFAQSILQLAVSSWGENSSILCRKDRIGGKASASSLRKSASCNFFSTSIAAIVGIYVKVHQVWLGLAIDSRSKVFLISFEMFERTFLDNLISYRWRWRWALLSLVKECWKWGVECITNRCKQFIS